MAPHSEGFSTLTHQTDCRRQTIGRQQATLSSSDIAPYLRVASARNSKKNCICLCSWNSGFFHDLIDVKVLELKGDIGSSLDLFVSNLVPVYVFSNNQMYAVDSWYFCGWTVDCDYYHDFVFNPKNSQIKNSCWSLWFLVTVFILNFETCCSNLADFLVQWWVQTFCSSPVISTEDQACCYIGYKSTLGDIAFAVFWAFSSLRHSQSCTVKLTLKVDLSVLKWSLTLPFRSNNRVCLSIFNLFLTHNTCHFTNTRKASLTVWTQSDFLF